MTQLRSRSAPTQPAALHLVVHGVVQGVGYRAALAYEAQRLRLGGWVRNRLDGTVEAVIHGAADACDALVAWAQHGPPVARVSRVETRAAVASELSAVEPHHFRMLPTA
jgi:acylphosphatase